MEDLEFTATKYVTVALLATAAAFLAGWLCGQHKARLVCNAQQGELRETLRQVNRELDTTALALERLSSDTQRIEKGLGLYRPAPKANVGPVGVRP